MLPAASAWCVAVAAAKVLVSEPACTVLATAEPARSGTSAAGTSAMNREAKIMLSMHAVMWKLSSCNCLHGHLNADACTFCSINHYRYLAGPLSLDSKSPLQSVPVKMHVKDMCIPLWPHTLCALYQSKQHVEVLHDRPPDRCRTWCMAMADALHL